MDGVDCLFKALGIGYFLWMLSFLFLQPPPSAEVARAVRPWWLDYQQGNDLSTDVWPNDTSGLERRN